MEEPHASPSHRTVSITERLRASCGNSLVDFVFRERGKSYLRLLCGTNGERISSTRVLTGIIRVSGAPDTHFAADPLRSPPRGPHIALYRSFAIPPAQFGTA
jgi:hypothetical protein